MPDNDKMLRAILETVSRIRKEEKEKKDSRLQHGLESKLRTTLPLSGQEQTLLDSQLK